MEAATEATTKKSVKVKVPTTIGAAIDELDRLRDARRAYEALAEKEREREKALEDAIFEKFDKAKLEGARGKRAQATIARREHATIEDYDALAKYIRKTGELDLLQRRLSGPAVRERWEEKKAVPGVGKFIDLRLTLTKVKAKK
jgi:hypothetical protein